MSDLSPDIFRVSFDDWAASFPSGSKLEVVRLFRNTLLASSDWTQLSDVTVDKQAWATYRQQLRDMTNGLTEDSIITFPTPPIVFEESVEEEVVE
jgi:hypothetical protein